MNTEWIEYRDVHKKKNMFWHPRCRLNEHDTPPLRKGTSLVVCLLE